MRMYKFNETTSRFFQDRTGINLTAFFDENIPRAAQESIITLLEIEYDRGVRTGHEDNGLYDIGYDDGYKAAKKDHESALEDSYNCGYDDAMNDYTTSRDDAYNEGFGQALQAAQDAILHIGR